MTTIFQARHYALFALLIVVVIGAMVLMLDAIHQVATNDDPPTWRTVCTKRDNGDALLYMAMGIPSFGEGECLQHQQICKAGPGYTGPVVCTDPKPTQPAL